MPTANINDTLFATSAPLSLTQGFALFPSGPGPFTPGSTVSGLNQSLQLLNESDNFGYFRLDANSALGIFFGFAGPAYDLHFHARGQTQDGGLAWAALSDDSEEAGVLFGAYLSLTFNLSFSIGISVLTFSWSDTLLNENQDFTYDLIGGLADEINATLESLGASGPLLVPVNVPIGANGVTMPSQDATAWGFLAQGSNQFARGSMTLTPGLNLYIDIAKDIPYVSDLAAFASALGGTLSFGPTVDVSVPVTIDVTGLSADGATYTVSGSGTLSPAQAAAYNQTLANALQSAYSARSWASPGAAAFLTQAQQAVTAGQYPTVAAWFQDTITAAGGTVPPPPVTPPPVVPGAPPGALTFGGGPAVGPATVTNLTVLLQHSVTFVFTVGFSISLGIDSYNYSNTWSFDLISLLGLPTGAGPYDDRISAVNGASTAPPLGGLVETAHQIRAQLADVVFEVPA